MNDKLRIGILGPGRIAEAFAQAVPGAGGCVLQAAASWDTARAEDFARRYGAASAHADYGSLLAADHRPGAVPFDMPLDMRKSNITKPLPMS